MRLSPAERDRLLVFQVAELARRRRSRGLLLNAPEATALVADAVLEAARSGARHSEAIDAGANVLNEAELLPGVAQIVGPVSVEAVFDDGTRLVVVPKPFAEASSAPRISGALDPAPGALLPRRPTWEPKRGVGASDQGEVDVVNTAETAISVTSHFHFFEVNRRLQFDRRLGYGRRLAIPAGEVVRWEPGERKRVPLTPIGGQRIAIGFSGLVDGPLDAPGAVEAALARGRAEGFRGCDPDEEGAGDD